MAAGTVIAAIGLAITAYGTYRSQEAQAAARKNRKDARRAAQRQAALQNARERTRAIAEGRRRRAQLEAVGEAQGVGQSSSVIGAGGAFQSDLASNLSFQSSLGGLEQRKQSALGRAADLQSQAGTFGAIASVPSQFGFGTQSSFRQLFK